MKRTTEEKILRRGMAVFLSLVGVWFLMSGPLTVAILMDDVQRVDAIVTKQSWLMRLPTPLLSYPLALAAGKGSMMATKDLIEHGADVNAVGFMGDAALHDAAQGGYTGVVSVLLQAGASLNLRAGRVGGTPLHHAVAAGHMATIRQLIAAGADVNARDRSMRTPLMCAAANGKNAAVIYLLAAGADPTLVDRMGEDALREATLRNRADVVRTLQRNNWAIRKLRNSGQELPATEQ